MKPVFRSTLAIVLMLLVGLSAAPATAVDGGYDVTVSDAYGLPEQTLTFEGTNYSVDGYLVTNPGADHTVEVTAPDEAYELTVYNNTGAVMERFDANGTSSFDLDFEGYAVGEYLLAVSHDGEIRDVFPVVVRGYTTSVDAPSSAEIGATVDVRVEVTRTIARDQPSGVLVYVSDDEMTVTATATERSDGSYLASVDTSSLDASTYAVWAVATCEVGAFGHTEIEGLTAPATLDLTAPEPESDDDDDDASAASVATESPTPTPTVTSSPSPTSTESPTATSIDSPEPTDEPRTEVVTNAPSPSPEADGPVDATVAAGAVVLATVGGLLWWRF